MTAEPIKAPFQLLMTPEARANSAFLHWLNIGPGLPVYGQLRPLLGPDLAYEALSKAFHAGAEFERKKS